MAVGVAPVAAGRLVPFFRLGVRPAGPLRRRSDQPVFDIALRQVGVGKQTLKVLNHRGIVTIGDLPTRDPDEILNLPGMDPLQLTGIRENLVRHGILPAVEEEDAA